MAEPKPIAEHIVSRALQVQRMGSYIGAFELVVWSVLQNVKVGLAVGGSVHQMREWFMPALPEPPDSAGTHYLVACNFGTSRQLHPVDTFAFGHPRFHHSTSSERLCQGMRTHQLTLLVGRAAFVWCA